MSKLKGERDRARSKVADPSVFPYPPSWMDRIVNWIDSLSLHSGSFYIIVILIFAIFSNIVLWIDGSLPFGEIDLLESALSILVFYWLALYHYLTHLGSNALMVFRPLLEIDDAELAIVNYRLGTLPSSLGRVAIILGVSLQILTFVVDPASVGSSANPAYLIANFVTMIFIAITFIAFTIRSARQLRLVSKLHSGAMKINMLDLSPAHAFASLTSRTGIGLILILIFGLTYAPTNVVDLFLYAVIAVLAIAIFVGPLLGIRKRIEESKVQAIKKVNKLLEIANNRLYGVVEKDSYKSVREINSAITGLVEQKERLEKTSTWPWDTSTFRQFASTLLLPIFLLIISRVIETIF